MPLTILVADDSATMRRVLEMTFAGENAHVICVDSGNAAVQAAVENRPDIVLADASMEGFDGYDVARTLKSVPELAHLRVILLGSQHTPYDETRGRASGVDEHVLKPFDTRNLIERVRRLTSQAASLPPPVMPAAAAAAYAPPPESIPPVREPSTRVPEASPIDAQSLAPLGAARVVERQPQTIVPEDDEFESRPSIIMTARPPSASPAQQAAHVVNVSSAKASADFAGKLQTLGLTQSQMEGVLALSRDVIERVVWEVVPNLAETIIREELKRLTSE